MKRLIWIEAVLLLLASTSQAQDVRPEDFLPLAVGNSWSYTHSYWDMFYARPVPGYEWPDEQPPDWMLNSDHEITLTITHTEQINGKTYYVFSDVSYEWPPVPYFFLAGKKVRFAEDGRLMERWQDTEEICLFDFGKVEVHGVPGSEGWYRGQESYSIPEYEEDTDVEKTLDQLEGLADRFRFIFTGHEDSQGNILESRFANFLQFFGMNEAVIKSRPLDLDHPSFVNLLTPHYAILNGKRIEVQGAYYRQTMVLPNTWGQVKRVFLYRAIQGETR